MTALALHNRRGGAVASGEGGEEMGDRVLDLP